MEMKWFMVLGALALLVIVALLLYIAAKKGYRNEVYAILYNLVCRAEMHFEGSGRGAEKKAWVIKEIHAKLPAWAKILVSEADIDNLIELAVEQMKKIFAKKAQEE